MDLDEELNLLSYNNSKTHSEIFSSKERNSGFTVFEKQYFSLFGPKWRAEQKDCKGIFLSQGLQSSNRKVYRVFQLIVDGKSNHEINRLTGADRKYIQKCRTILLKLSGKAFFCKCGLDVQHSGMCSFRFGKRKKHQIIQSGTVFGRLTILSFAYRKDYFSNGLRYYHYYYNCICRCGEKTLSIISNLKNGHTKSCGCIRR